ncbi:MAG: rhodanese-like domain-containing protein [Vampirovibrionales bacterium]|nr:rhodanese-like domain-containing protein [Vampirovibrionales bacterium]
MTFLYDTINNATLAKLLTQPDVILLDVRSVEEYEQLGHVPNAVLFPMDQIPTRLVELPKDRPLVIMCQHGVRSAMVCEYLVDQGFRRVFNHDAGMSVWDGDVAYDHDDAGTLPKTSAVKHVPLF